MSAALILTTAIPMPTALTQMVHSHVLANQDSVAMDRPVMVKKMLSFSCLDFKSNLVFKLQLYFSYLKM